MIYADMSAKASELEEGSNDESKTDATEKARFTSVMIYLSIYDYDAC